MSLPKFDFSKATIKTSAQLDTELAALGEKQSKHFRPGQYEVEVTTVTHQGPAKDSNWHKFLLTLSGVGGKEITHQILVPVTDIEYTTSAGKKTLFMFKKFVSAMLALTGTAVTVENLQDVLIKNFTNAEKVLLGKRLSIDVGYEGNYVKYDGKTAEGGKRYLIALQTGAYVNDESGNPQIFGDYATAELRAEQLSIEISKYVNVIAMNKSSSAPMKAAVGW